MMGGSSIDSSNSDISGVKAGGGSLSNAFQYPTPPNQYNQTNTFPRSTSPYVAAYLNPRDRVDRSMSAAHAYGTDEYTSQRDGYDAHSGRFV
jgi:hypothetical protein